MTLYIQHGSSGLPRILPSRYENSTLSDILDVCIFCVCLIVYIFVSICVCF